MTTPVPTCTDHPIPDKPGYVTERARPVAEVIGELNAQLAPLFDEGRFSDVTAWTKAPSDPAPMWPLRWAWIACYAVTGGSEGHYIHIDVITRETRVAVAMGLCKTFQGYAHACAIAAAAGEILGS